MVQIVIGLLASLIPSLAFYFWLKKLDKEKPGYEETVRKSLIYGMLSPLPVVGAAFVFTIVSNLLGLRNAGSIVRKAVGAFVTAALFEEASKFIMFRRVLQKSDCAYSWMNVTAFMTLVGIGFGIPEAVEYSIGANVIQILVRGVTLMHGGYGFIMGYFYGKGRAEKNSSWYAAAFLIPFLLHGTYDFTLSESVLALNENIAFIPVTLAILAVITLILMIVFFIKAPKNETYTAPLMPEKKTAVPVSEQPADK